MRRRRRRRRRRRTTTTTPNNNNNNNNSNNNNIFKGKQINGISNFQKPLRSPLVMMNIVLPLTL